MICPACSNNNADDSLFCAKCGAYLRTPPRVCPRCGVSNDPIFQFCRACSTDLDDPPPRYAEDAFTQSPNSAYAPFTTPFQSAESEYAVKSTPFFAETEPPFMQYEDGGRGDGFAPPQAPFPLAPDANAFYPTPPEPTQYGPLQPQAQPPPAGGYAPDAFAQPQFGAYVREEQPQLTTAKRARRRLKWLLRALLALLALALLASGMFAYLDRLAHGEKLPAITESI